MSDFERNGQRYNAEEMAAVEMARLLSQREMNADINLDWPRHVEGRLRQEWAWEGYGEPLAFVTEEGEPLMIARLEDEDLYDDKGLIRRDRDISYRIYLPSETRDVIIPHQLAPGAGQDLWSDDYTFYDLSDEMAAFELALMDEGVQANVQWLHEKLGPTLVARKAGMVPPRLVAGEKIHGIRLDAFSRFSESDF